MTLKEEKVRGLKTEVIERILSTLSSPEDKPRSPEYPLGGLVHIEGVGQVSVTQLRNELARRG